MKKTVLLISSILLTVSGCSKAKETIDALDGLACIETASRLSNNDDDLSCSELVKELEKLERDCRAYLDDDTRADIALLKASCTDN
ncbi:hypothetical protein [Pareuzebyella sediminis]|uniref:hypothetical protein n=1 Tax=Pareuzebyella sediminis TaxID=2607998 RepID=UPI0011EC70EC|nr:hypothetical protein [Pareuzebyella sediminis]